MWAGFEIMGIASLATTFKECNMAKSKIIVRNNQGTVRRNSDGSTVTSSTKKIGGKHVIKGYSHTPSGRRK